MTNYLDLPDKLISASILPKLAWNDLLRHRRVCKLTRDVTTEYMREKPELAPEIELVEGREDRSFQAFLQMDIPTTKLAIRNLSADLFYENSDRQGDMTRWMGKYGGKIRHLRVLELSVFLYGKEWQFLTGLPNLESLTAARQGEGVWAGCTTNFPIPDLQKCHTALAAQRLRCYSSNFDPTQYPNLPEVAGHNYDPVKHVLILSKRLKSLTIGQEKKPWPPVRNDVNRVIRVLSNDEITLEFASLPFNQYWEPHTCPIPGAIHQRQCIDMAFRALEANLRKRVTAKDGQTANSGLKEFDFINFHDNFGNFDEISTHFIASATFLRIAHLSVLNNVKLHNVASFWFVYRRAMEPLFSQPEMGLPVVSLVNMHPAVCGYDMSNLEKIEIKSTYRSHVPDNMPGVKRPKWPNLKCLDITIEGRTCQGLVWYDIHPSPSFLAQSTLPKQTKELLEFFFNDVFRPSVTELRLNFPKEDLKSMPTPKVDQIMASCPNLKKLAIINWPGTNKALIELFEGLPHLEEVTLDSCKNVGNVTFVGLDTTNPVFLKLKKLRKLSLHGLEAMPKITDLLFDLVLRKLSLSNLIFTSKEPLKSITEKGIKALLDGPFAESIEKFPFRNWSLDGVSEKDFADLAAKFRASRMI